MPLAPAALAAGAQSVVVQRADGASVELSAAPLAALPHAPLRVTLRDAALRFDAVDLLDLLRAAGVDVALPLHGAALRRVLAVQAADGYAAL